MSKTLEGRPDALGWLVERPIAHRGLHDGRTVIENSLGAFAAAVENGYAIECDVQPLADGTVATFHDESLERLTGERGSVRQLDVEAYSRLRLSGSGEAPPTLPQTLDLVAGRVPLIVELKGFESVAPDFVARVARDCAGYEGPVAIMSFDHDLVSRFRNDAPGLPHGLTAEGTETDEFDKHELVAASVDFLSYNVKHLPNDFVKEFRASGRPVITWTVRSADDLRVTSAYADQMTFEGFRP